MLFSDFYRFIASQSHAQLSLHYTYVSKTVLLVCLFGLWAGISSLTDSPMCLTSSPPVAKNKSIICSVVCQCCGLFTGGAVFHIVITTQVTTVD